MIFLGKMSSEYYERILLIGAFYNYLQKLKNDYLKSSKKKIDKNSTKFKSFHTFQLSRIRKYLLLFEVYTVFIIMYNVYVL